MTQAGKITVEITGTPPPTPLKARSDFGRWLRVRLQHEEKLEERYGVLLNVPDPIRAIFTQLAADADHSALLLRLLSGLEPLTAPPAVEHAYPVYRDCATQPDLNQLITPFEKLAAIAAEATNLQGVTDQPERWEALHGALILAALYEIPDAVRAFIVLGEQRKYEQSRISEQRRELHHLNTLRKAANKPYRERINRLLVGLGRAREENEHLRRHNGGLVEQLIAARNEADELRDSVERSA